MNLNPLADQLIAAGLGVDGESIFVNMMPAECKQGILLRNRYAGTKINYELPGYFKCQFQIIVRSKDYTAGLALINQATAALTVSQTQIGGCFFNYMRPQTKPVSFPLSGGSNLEFSVYMDANLVETVPGSV